MRITIDPDRRVLCVESDDETISLPLYGRRAFEIISRYWVRVGWACKYGYCFSWMGRPIIQLPEDVVRVQEAIYQLRPDVVVETGVAHGGSLVLYASILKAIGTGRVVGIDVEIRPHNRRAIETHELSSLITLVEGDSVSAETVARIRGLIAPEESVMVILDSCHTKSHVGKELEAYAPLVTVGSYIVVTDGIMEDVCDTPRGKPEWKTDNPVAAAKEFLAEHPDFVEEQPTWPFNESDLNCNVTHWPHAWLRRV